MAVALTPPPPAAAAAAAAAAGEREIKERRLATTHRPHTVSLLFCCAKTGKKESKIHPLLSDR